MSDISWLNAEENARFFGPESGHLPLVLRRLSRARIVWINKQYAEHDPLFQEAGAVGADYEQHILSSCAFVHNGDGEYDCASFASDSVLGMVDRYGGPGIGLNGGSGRAAIVNGYLVKGIGRTPLVSSLTPASHASGGAYLEETVRETIYAEIARAEFPCSAIPVLAIIDTGLIQVFHQAGGTKIERRTLLVRPSFIRPAHFYRAPFLSSLDERSGCADTARVEKFSGTFVAQYGPETAVATFEHLWCRWAQQLAYSFVHRLPHGSHTVSNICLDGKLLDFGAMSSVPSWANVATMLERQSFSAHERLIQGIMHSAKYYLERYLGMSGKSPEYWFGLEQAIGVHFKSAIVQETLRLCGLSRAQCQGQGESTYRLIRRIFDHFQVEYLDIVEGKVHPQIEWDLSKVWNDRPPEHLAALQSLLKTLVSEDEWPAARAQCRLKSRTRSAISRVELKEELFQALEGGSPPPETDRERVEQLIMAKVSMSRRDHQLEAAGAKLVGFAVNSDESLVLFQKLDDDVVFAVREPFMRENANGVTLPPVPVHRLSGREIIFANNARPPFIGAVSFFNEVTTSCPA